MDNVTDLPCFAECLELLTAQDLIRSSRSSKSWSNEVRPVLERRHARLGLCAIGGLLDDQDQEFASTSQCDDYVFALKRTLAQLAWLPQTLVLFCTEESDGADLCADSTIDRTSLQVHLPPGCKTIVATCDGVVGPDLFTGQARELYDETDDAQGISFLLLRSGPDSPPPALLRCHKSQAEGSPAPRWSWGKRTARKQQLQRWMLELGHQSVPNSTPNRISETSEAGPELALESQRARLMAGPRPGSLHLLLVCDEDRGEWAEHCMSALNNRKSTDLEDHQVVGGYVSGLSVSLGLESNDELAPADMVLLTIFGGGLGDSSHGDSGGVSGHRERATALGWPAAERPAAHIVGRVDSAQLAVPEPASVLIAASSSSSASAASSSSGSVGSRAVVMDENVPVGADYFAGAAKLLTAAGVDGAAPIAAATLAASKSTANSAVAPDDVAAASVSLETAADSPIPPPSPPPRTTGRSSRHRPPPAAAHEPLPSWPTLPPPNFEPKFGFGNGKPSTMAQCKTSKRTMINDKMAINAEPSLKGNRLQVTLQIKIIH